MNWEFCTVWFVSARLLLCVWAVTLHYCSRLKSFLNIWDPWCFVLLQLYVLNCVKFFRTLSKQVLLKNADDKTRKALLESVKRLMHPQEMGDAFKFLAIAPKDVDYVPPGFTPMTAHTEQKSWSMERLSVHNQAMKWTFFTMFEGINFDLF